MKIYGSNALFATAMLALVSPQPASANSAIMKGNQCTITYDGQIFKIAPAEYEVFRSKGTVPARLNDLFQKVGSYVQQLSPDLKQACLQANIMLQIHQPR